MKHLLGGHAFGVDIGGFLDLQRRLHRHHASRPGAGQPDFAVGDVGAGEGFHQRLCFERATHRIGELLRQHVAIESRGGGSPLADRRRDGRQNTEGSRE